MRTVFPNQSRMHEEVSAKSKERYNIEGRAIEYSKIQENVEEIHSSRTTDLIKSFRKLFRTDSRFIINIEYG